MTRRACIWPSRSCSRRDGYEYCGATDAESGMEMLAAEKPDLLLFRRYAAGYERVRSVHASSAPRVGAFPLSSCRRRTTLWTSPLGFRAGGDDYVTKPFDATELHSAYRGPHPPSQGYDGFRSAAATRDGSVTIGDLEVRFDEYQVLVHGVPANLTTKEFEIVAFLATHPGKVFTRGQIQEYIWGEGRGGRALELHHRVRAQDTREDRGEPQRAQIPADGAARWLQNGRHLGVGTGCGDRVDHAGRSGSRRAPNPKMKHRQILKRPVRNACRLAT